MQEAAEGHVPPLVPALGGGKAPTSLWQLRPSFHRHRWQRLCLPFPSLRPVSTTNGVGLISFWTCSP